MVTTQALIQTLSIEITLAGASDVGDLEMVLTSPTGVSAAIAPLFGTSTLVLTTEFYNENPFGTWILAITDNAKGNTHTLTGWSLTINDSAQAVLVADASLLAATGLAAETAPDVAGFVAQMDWLSPVDQPGLFKREIRSGLVAERFSQSQRILSAASVVETLRKQSSLVVPAPVPIGAFEDTDDLPILGTAVAGQADCLVTGDKKLLGLGNYQAIPILSPRMFYDSIRDWLCARSATSCK